MAKIQLSEPARVRLSDPADLAAAIPYLLGFPPEESLVVISLRGPRKRIGLTMRWDLPDESLDDDFAEQIALRLAANSADFAVSAPTPRNSSSTSIGSPATTSTCTFRRARCRRTGRPPA